jgi:hypothetical protein
LSVASNPTLRHTTPSQSPPISREPIPYQAFLTSGYQWASLCVDSELRELWARGVAYHPYPPDPCPTCGYLSVRIDGHWIDTRQVDWEYDWLPETNILKMNGQVGTRAIELTALSEQGNNLLALHYKITPSSGEPIAYRYHWHLPGD